jgi:hypothetical protein
MQRLLAGVSLYLRPDSGKHEAPPCVHSLQSVHTSACSWYHNGPGDPSMIVMHVQINVLSSIKQAEQWPDQQQPWGWQGQNTRKLQSFLPDDINNQV